MLSEILFMHSPGRDEWIARRIVDALKSDPKAKMLVLLGTFHVLKQFPWQDPARDNYLSVPGYLKEIARDIRWFSISPCDCEIYFTEFVKKIP